MRPLMCLLFLVACLHSIQGGDVLVVFPVPTMSHHIVGETLAKALAKNGHHVTIITPFATKNKPHNYSEIVLAELVEWKEKSLKKLTSFNSTVMDLLSSASEIDGISRGTLENPSVKALLRSEKTFDAVLIDPLASEALHGLSYFYKAPTIIVNTQGTISITDRMVGNSRPFAYVPNAMLPFTDEMSFLQRTTNTLSIVVMKFVYDLLFMRQQNIILHEHFPEAPSVWELCENVSLMLLNAHYSVVETPRPYMPNMIQVGGLHIQSQTLPKELKKYLDEAENGVVYFSLGSNLKTADLPKDKVDVILNTLARFPQRFLWKFENEALDNVPANVKISKWLPQRAILDHPNTKAFITHGGLLSVTEAVFYAVPFVGIPAFADQPYNIRNAAHRKVAVEFDMSNLNEVDFTAAIKEILENPIYKRNIAKFSSLLREQPVPPIDLAVYWVEHVLKYKGAAHLQSSGLKLHWIQSHLLDVLGFILTLICLVIYINFIVIRASVRFLQRKFCCKKKTKSSHKKKD